jgi:hypothetical protein
VLPVTPPGKIPKAHQYKKSSPDFQGFARLTFGGNFVKMMRMKDQFRQK